VIIDWRWCRSDPEGVGLGALVELEGVGEGGECTATEEVVIGQMSVGDFPGRWKTYIFSASELER
jgi:hypothetical protein